MNKRKNRSKKPLKTGGNRPWHQLNTVHKIVLKRQAAWVVQHDKRRKKKRSFWPRKLTVHLRVTLKFHPKRSIQAINTANYFSFRFFDFSQGRLPRNWIELSHIPSFFGFFSCALDYQPSVLAHTTPRHTSSKGWKNSAIVRRRQNWFHYLSHHQI